VSLVFAVFGCLALRSTHAAEDFDFRTGKGPLSDRTGRLMIQLGV